MMESSSGLQCLLALGFRHAFGAGVWPHQDRGLDSSLRGGPERTGVCLPHGRHRTLGCGLRFLRTAVGRGQPRRAVPRCNRPEDDPSLRRLVLRVYRRNPDESHARSEHRPRWRWCVGHPCRIGHRAAGPSLPIVAGILGFVLLALCAATLWRPVLNLSGRAGYEEGRWGYDALVANRNRGNAQAQTYLSELYTRSTSVP